jgi:predicted oxidoreductase (fatty acid repression mutant protein)
MRKYLPTLSELIDRLTINQIKEVKIPHHRETYKQEIEDILHDIDQIIKDDKLVLNSETIRAIIIIAQYNLHIWMNEANYRAGIKNGNDLELSHSLNGVRNRAKNIVQSLIGGRTDLKVDCLAAEYSQWEPSWSKQ